jgi:hypothetical protein
MRCAYCGNGAKGTREHIISCSVLDLFPECFATTAADGKTYQVDYYNLDLILLRKLN